MAVRMLFQIGLKLLASIAVLDGVPEGKIESLRGDFLGCRRRGLCGRERGGIKPCSGERGKGTLRILLEVGFELGRAAVLDAVPKRELEGDLVVGGQFGDRRRSGRRIRVPQPSPRGSGPLARTASSPMRSRNARIGCAMFLTSCSPRSSKTMPPR